jgi:methylmalonyl-CoA/ethylmalonyl-CoA epimerase
MTIEKISHIGIAVRDLDQQIRLYRDVLGLELVHVEEIEDQQVRVAMFRIGESAIELLTPLSDESPVARHLDRRGEGIHHIAYQVRELAQMLLALEAQGVELVDKSPRRGAGGKRIAFLHPTATRGVLTELCE